MLSGARNCSTPLRRLRRPVRSLLTPVESYVRALIRDEMLTRPHILGGDPMRLQIAPTAVVHNALFNLGSGIITVEPLCFLRPSRQPSYP